MLAACFSDMQLLIGLLFYQLTTGLASPDAPLTGQDVYNLSAKNEYVETKKPDQELKIFCYYTVEKSAARFWSSAELRLDILNDNYHVFIAPNVSAVKEKHSKHQASWFYSSLPWKPSSIKLNPFENACVAVLTEQSYRVIFHFWNINYLQLLMTVAGLTLVLYAPVFCRNVFFHYTTGVVTGICLSFLVITYIIHRRSNFWTGWMAMCYSLSFYFITSVWYNIQTYLIEYQTLFLGYFLLSGAISFAICYRMGPVRNQRSLDLIQWTLQACGLLLIYLSSYHQVLSLSLVLIVLAWINIPAVIITKVQVHFRRTFFKPKIRLLTEEEYIDQSRVETEKALRELRDFCRSPKCNAWNTTLRLRSPSRFAEFVEGGSHITQDEIINYSQLDYDSDNDDNDDDDGERMEGYGLNTANGGGYSD